MSSETNTYHDSLHRDVEQGLRGLIAYRGIWDDAVLRSFRSLVTELRTVPVVKDSVNDSASSESALSAFGDRVAMAYFNFLSELLSSSTAKPSADIGTLWQEHLLDVILFCPSLVMEALCREGEPQGGVYDEAIEHDLKLLSKLFWAFEDGLGQLILDTIGDAPIPESGLLERLHGGLNLEGTGKLRSEVSKDPSTEAASENTLTGGSSPSAEEVLIVAARELKGGFYQTRNWAELLPSLVDYHSRYGTGEYARCAAFTWHSGFEGGLVGIRVSDPIRLHVLSGYEEQVQQVVQNTQRFLEGLPAHNLLLYGDRGTGKSSTVKGLLHRFAYQGLRLVEVGRGDLGGLHKLMDHLGRCSLRFVLFIDDLSFEDDETEFKELKSVLEGSVVSQPGNVRVYATSNRRHLIKERFSDVASKDEVRWQDTVQEKLSLSDRFGRTIVYPSPDQKTYLAIVEHLAELAELPIGKEELRARALQWTLWHNERSGRTARQFIDELQAELHSKS